MPVEFVILEMEEDTRIPIILGRPFLVGVCIGYGPDRPGLKTEFRVGGGTRTGPDRSEPSICILLASNAARSACAQWHDRAASFPENFFFWHQDRPVQPSDARFPGQQCSTVCLCLMARPCHLLPRNFFFCSNSVHRSGPLVQPRTGPNSVFCWTKDRTEEDRSEPVLGSVWSRTENCTPLL